MAHERDGGQRLDSWKTIAHYLQRDVRTAMRWAQSDGLPVRRIGEGRHRAVYAYREEIDAWLAARPLMPQQAATQTPAAVADSLDNGAARLSWSLRRYWFALVGVGLIGAVGVGFLSLKSLSASVVRAAVVGPDLVAFDSQGRELWRYELAPASETPEATLPHLIQWDAGGSVDVLLAERRHRSAGDGSGSLLLVRGDGRLGWRRVLDDRYRFGEVEYGPTWYPTSIATYRVGGDWRVAAAFHHHMWWPAIVAVFDRDGRPAGEFVNAGWIHTLTVSRDGRYLLAGGVSNAFGGAVLAVLDPSRLSGASPAEGGALPVCDNCPNGAPIAYFVVPWSDVARPADTPAVVVEVSDTGEITLRAVQRLPRDGPIPELIVTLSPSLEVTRREAGDGFRDMHTLLERQSQLDHPYEKCPWRVPAVRKWTPARGWE